MADGLFPRRVLRNHGNGEVDFPGVCIPWGLPSIWNLMLLYPIRDITLFITPFNGITPFNPFAKEHRDHGPNIQSDLWPGGPEEPCEPNPGLPPDTPSPNRPVKTQQENF